MSTGIGVGISPVFNQKAGASAPVCDNLYSVLIDNTDVSQVKYLSNTSDSISLGLNGTGDFSISFWIYPTDLGTGSNMRLISFGSGSTLPFTNIYINNAGNGLQFSCSGGSDVVNDGTSAFNPTVNEWVYMTFTMSRTSTTSTSNWYADGVEIAGPVNKPFPQSTNILTNSAGNPLYIGRNPGTAQRMRGNFDDVTIWNKSLIQSEIIEVMNVTTTNACMDSLSFYSDLSHWWTMGDPDGQASYPTIVDSIGSVDMTMNGMAASNITTNVPT